MSGPQLHQPSSSIEVPINVIQSLIASINNLKSEVTQLREERIKDKAGIVGLELSVKNLNSALVKRDIGRKEFALFPKFPREIRCMI